MKRSGSAGTFVIVLALLLITGGLTLAALDSGRGVDARTAGELAGVRAQAIAESAIEEAMHLIATGVNDPVSPVYRVFRKGLAEQPGAVEVPSPGDYPRTRALAPDVELVSVVVRVARHSAIVPGKLREYERTGTLEYEAVARARTRGHAPVRRVRVEQSFRVALATMPRPFDRMAFYVDDARQYLAPAQDLIEAAAECGLPVDRPGAPHRFEDRDRGLATRAVLMRPGVTVSLPDVLDVRGWVGTAASRVRESLEAGRTGEAMGAARTALARVQVLQDVLEEYTTASGSASAEPLCRLFEEKFGEAMFAKAMITVRPAAGERVADALARVWAQVDPERRALSGIVRIVVPPGDKLELSDRAALATWRLGRMVLIVDGDCAVTDVAGRDGGLLAVIVSGTLTVRGRVTAGLVALSDVDLDAGAALTGALICAREPGRLAGSLEYDPRLGAGEGDAPADHALVVALSPARERLAVDRSAE